MKKFLAYGIVAMAIVATSCEKKSDDNGDNNTFSPIPVEEHKANIEDEGMAMLDEMKLMENEPAIDANASLMSLLFDSEPFKGDSGAKKGALLNSIAFKPVVGTSNIGDNDITDVLKATLVSPVGEPETIQEFYDELVGTYEWNSGSYEWDYTEGGDAIVFKFPAEEGGSSNNASYTITYVGYTGTHPLKDDEDFDYDGDIPQNVAAVLAIDETEASKFTFDVVYNSDGYPTAVDVVFSLGTFVWSGSLTNTVNKEFDASVSFMHGDKILIKATLGAAGNWSQENIENNQFETTIYVVSRWDDDAQEWIYEEYDEPIDDYDYTWTQYEFHVHNVVKEGNASFQFMNLKIVGDIDADALGVAMLELEDTYNWDEDDEEEAVAAEVEAINENVSLTLRYADNNNIIAMVEAYPVEETNSWMSGEWNAETQEWEEVEVIETYYWIDFRFVFADESRVDFDTYFTDGFQDLLDELEAWADDLEDVYGK